MRTIKVSIIPVEHDSLINQVDFAAIIKKQTGKDIDSSEVSKMIQSLKSEVVEISTLAFDKISDEQWKTVKGKAEIPLQKFVLALRTAMQLSLEGDDYSLKIIAGAVQHIEEEVTFRAVCELDKPLKG